MIDVRELYFDNQIGDHKEFSTWNIEEEALLTNVPVPTSPLPAMGIDDK